MLIFITKKVINNVFGINFIANSDSSIVILFSTYFREKLDKKHTRCEVEFASLYTLKTLSEAKKNGEAKV